MDKRTNDGVTPEEDPTFLKKAKLESARREEHDIGPTVFQGRGNRSKEISWTWHLGQLKERAGFLVSLSRLAHRGLESSFWWFSPLDAKKITVQSQQYFIFINLHWHVWLLLLRHELMCISYEKYHHRQRRRKIGQIYLFTSTFYQHFEYNPFTHSFHLKRVCIRQVLFSNMSLTNSRILTIIYK